VPFALQLIIMKKLYFIFLILIIGNSVVGQTNLPAGLTLSEIRQLQDYTPPIYNRSVFTTPPNLPVRTMAEWEEAQALTITWTSYPNVLREIVRHAKEEVEVIIICNDSIFVKNYLSNYNITNENISFIEKPYNSIWIRDYGQHSVYLNEVDSLVLVDWIYNRPRLNDDLIPQWVADKTGLDLYATTANPTDLVSTGGNFMSDGMGTGFSSDLILDENSINGSFNVSPKTAAEIDTIMKQFMGIEPYIKMSKLPYDGIHHIDMHMKLLDEETLLIGEYPNGIADGPQIEANINYILNNFQTPFGTSYRIVRVQMPPDQFGRYPDNNGHYRTYTNSVFINKTILVPIYQPLYDSDALEVYRQNMPGYKVIGINCNSIIPSGGALHCITKLVGVADPLRIVHQPIRGTTCFIYSNQIDAMIQHKSGIANAIIHYTTDTTQLYQTVSMTNLGNDNWQGFIPPQNTISEVFYYISATANSGKVQNRPMPAPQA
jgi:agmatine deiminase